MSHAADDYPTFDPSQVELVVLDVNETLSDPAGLDQAFATVGLPGQAGAWFAAVLRDAFALTLHGVNPAFADLGADGVRSRLATSAPNADVEDAVGTVLGAFTSLDVHPDVVPGIRALREAGVRVVTLSNGAASVAEGLLTRAGVADAVERFLSVEDAGAWKPDAAAYRHALEQCDVEPAAAVLVAVHPWDVDGARRAGMRAAFVDRTGGTPYPPAFSQPDLTVPGLDALAARLHPA